MVTEQANLARQNDDLDLIHGFTSEAMNEAPISSEQSTAGSLVHLMHELGARMTEFTLEEALNVRRRLLQDNRLLTHYGDAKLKTVFNLITVAVMRQLDRSELETSYDNGFKDLLPAITRGYPLTHHQEDRQVLSRAYLRLCSFSAGDAVSRPKADPVSPPAKAEPYELADESASEFFDREFLPHFRRRISDRLRLLVIPISCRTLFLKPSFDQLFWSQFVESFALEALEPAVKACRSAFLKTCPRGATPVEMHRHLDNFCSQAEGGLTPMVTGLGQLLQNFPRQRLVAQKHMEGRAKPASRFYRLIKVGRQRDRSTMDMAGRIVQVDNRLARANGIALGLRDRKIPDRDFIILGRFLESIDPERIEDSYFQARYYLSKMDRDEASCEEAAVELREMFRDNGLSVTEVGAVFSMLVHWEPSFDLRVVDAFFQEPRRYGREKVFAAFPYLKVSLAWYLNLLVGTLLEQKEICHTPAFDNIFEKFRASKRILKMLEMHRVANDISLNLFDSKLEFASDAPRQAWQKKIASLN